MPKSEKGNNSVKFCQNFMKSYQVIYILYLNRFLSDIMDAHALCLLLTADCQLSNFLFFENSVLNGLESTYL